MYATTIFICGECGDEYDEEDYAEDCCTPAGDERRRVEELERVGQLRLPVDDAVDRFIRTNEWIVEKETAQPE